MLVSELPLLEITAATTACISVYLYGNGTIKAPLFGLGSQVFWWWWTIEEGLYFMMVLNIFMTLTHIRNIFKMKGRQTNDDE
tara:strand:+ start:2567 stop:2812 length:246 start_codon:yes stop_codon:yes gene_type:complete